MKLQSLTETYKTITEKFHAGVKSKDDSEYYEIYKNPTETEVEDLIKAGRSYYNGNEYAVRWGLTQDGNVYVWFYTMMHYVVEDSLKLRFIAQGLLHFHHGLKSPAEIHLGSVDTKIKYPSKANWDRVFASAKVHPDSTSTVEFLNGWKEGSDIVNEKFHKSEHVWKAFDQDETVCEVYINPTQYEVQEVSDGYEKIDPDNYAGEQIRGIFDKKGNLYVWYANFFHDQVIARFEINPSEFRFSWIREEGENEIQVEDDDLVNFFKEKTPLKEEMLKRLKTAFPKANKINRYGGKNSVLESFKDFYEAK